DGVRRPERRGDGQEDTKRWRDARHRQPTGGAGDWMGDRDEPGARPFCLGWSERHVSKARKGSALLELIRPHVLILKVQAIGANYRRSGHITAITVILASFGSKLWPTASCGETRH